MSNKKIMTVKDLVEKLDEFDSNAEIVIEDSFTGCEDIVIDSQSDNLMVILTSSAENRYQKDLDERLHELYEVRKYEDESEDDFDNDITDVMYSITKTVLFLALWIMMLKFAWNF